MAAGNPLDTTPRPTNFPNVGVFSSLDPKYLCSDLIPANGLEFNQRVGSNRTSVLSYRFDENPGRDTQARFLATYKIAVIEDPNEVAQFVDQLRNSSKLYVRVVSHIAGTTTVEFPVKGAPAAIEAAFQNCPNEAASKPRSA